MFLGGRRSKCRKVRGLLSEYIDGRLGSEDTEFVDRHVETCRECSEEFETLRFTVRLLNRVPSVAVPRSFTIREVDVAPGPALPRKPRVLWPAPVFVAASTGVGRASILAPERLRWLRPATAVVAAALVLVLALDFLQVVPQDGQVNWHEQFDQPRTLTATSAPPEQMEDTLKLEDGEIEGAAPAPAPTSPAETTAGGMIQEERSIEVTNLVVVLDEPERGWPMRQIEIAVGSVFLALVAVMLVAWRRRRRWTGA